MTRAYTVRASRTSSGRLTGSPLPIPTAGDPAPRRSRRDGGTAPRASAPPRNFGPPFRCRDATLPDLFFCPWTEVHGYPPPSRCDGNAPAVFPRPSQIVFILVVGQGNLNNGAALFSVGTLQAARYVFWSARAPAKGCEPRLR